MLNFFRQPMASEREGYSTDESTKRRRDDDEREEDVGKKSRKVGRSPSKGMEDKLDRIVKMMEDMTMQMSDMKGDMKAMRREQKEFKEEIMMLKRENKELKEKYEEIKQEKDEMKKQLNEVRKNMEWAEKDRKRNNIVVTGMTVDTKNAGSMKQTIEHFIEKNLGVNINVKTAYKLAERSCRVELESEAEKQQVMENKSKLRNLKEQRVYIDNDMTKSEQYMRKQIRAAAEGERKTGKAVKIKFNKMIVEGKVWKWNEVTGELEKQKN